MSTPTERLYTPKDLEGKTKDELSKIIQSQLSKWPKDTFNPSKIKKEILVKEILAHGFSLRVETDSSAEENSGTLVPTPEDDANKDSPRSQALLHSRNSADIQVESEVDLETGEWLVNTKAILAALQKSPSSLNVKISIEDPVEVGWKRYFVKISGTEKLEAAETSSAQLKIPSTSRLKIFVEASEAFLNNRKHERSDSETDALQSHSTSSAAGPSRKRTSNADAADVAWLQNLLSERQGYAVFKKNQNKKLSNKDRVSFWDFAAEFCAQYFNKPSAAPGGLGKSIKKVSIEVALGMSPSALREAEKMTSILQIFGEGGTKHAQEVSSRAAADTVEGQELCQFLKSWNTAH
ncbi:hypothetical protein B0H13DRAFT_2415099 [Mycena leptocephala]|nr:hypothetical protein B0H13DRAFT_2415099 [Mycena leptocephala]